MSIEGRQGIDRRTASARTFGPWALCCKSWRKRSEITLKFFNANVHPTRIPLPAFQAQSRNNMSWKGSQVFPVAALQAVGVGAVPDFVGHWWGSSLS